MANVLMVSSEATPYAKTGGLADVLGSLPYALTRLGHSTAVILPRYGAISLDRATRAWDHLPVHFGPMRFDTSLYRIDAGSVPFFFLDCPALYGRAGIYGDPTGDYGDNHLRFALLARGAMELARRVWRPDVFHCHDWQSGLLPAYLRGPFRADPTFHGIPTVFTIHNLGYHGRFPAGVRSMLGLDAAQFNPYGVEYHGDISFMKAGLYYSDWLTTVSPTYAREIQTPEYGEGLDGLLRSRAHSLTGIVNGIDYSAWDPATDPYLAANYTADSLGGKLVCKRALIAESGLPADAVDRPLIGMVTRFADQKGLDLVAEVWPDILDTGASLILLGSGDRRYEDFFTALATAHPGQIAVRIGYDNGLAHRIEAGADMFLMPSRYEPCGLNQIYSLLYGTTPIVRATGGLDDTIDEETGFKFSGYTPRELAGCVRHAVAQWPDQKQWTQRMRTGMSRDFSWDQSAVEYAQLFQRLRTRRAA